MSAKMRAVVDSDPSLFIRFGCKRLGDGRLICQAAQEISDLAVDATWFGCKPRTNVDSHVFKRSVLYACPGS